MTADSNNCPWCGCEPRTVGHGLAKPSPKGQVDWRCGSFLHGTEPWQSTNCELNVEDAKAERLGAFVLKVYGLCDEHIAGCSKTGGKACPDCPVWTLRAEAAEIVKQEATA